MLQLSHLYMTTGKTIALTMWTFIGKVMSLLFNMLSRFVLTFLQEQASFNFMTAVTVCSDFWRPRNKIFHGFHFLPIFHEVMGQDAMILVFSMLDFKILICAMKWSILLQNWVIG